MSAPAINTFKGVKTINSTNMNRQNVPTSRIKHFTPSNIGVTGTSITAYQLMNSSLTANPTNPAPAPIAPWTMPTAQNLLAAYSGKVQVGDIFKVSLYNLGNTGMSVSVNSATGGTGSFSMGSGITASTLGVASTMKIQWLEVSSDGMTGQYRLF